MAMLGKRRPPRPASGHSGLARQPYSNGVPTKQPIGIDVGAPLSIERLAHDGRGVAHHPDGKTVFVDRALPGEQVEVAVHVTRKRFDEAHVKTLVTRSPQRVEPPCAHFGHCGGCDLQHLALDAQRAHKREVVSELMARQGVRLSAVTPINGQSEHYRRRARLGVKVDGQGNVRLGFRAANSHRLVDIEHCHVLVPSLKALLDPLKQLLIELDAPRSIGHIELLSTPKATVVLVRQLKEQPQDRGRWQSFADQHHVRFGIWLGRESPSLHWYGEVPALEERFSLSALGVTDSQTANELVLTFAPGDFLQVNAEVNQKMVAQVIAWLAPGQGGRLLDLFAGIGNFSLPIAAAGASVHAVEGSAAMVERLKANAELNRLVVSAQQADLNESTAVMALLDEHPVDAVVLDPPRSGAEAVCQALGRRKVAKIAYVSCDPATLARDAAHLVHAGYRVEHVAVADMFLHTAHMETLMLFEYAG
ncbi:MULTISPECIES: 23S rRNA (uracil(1939)-C(5))-methyltransferase RlmD [unclassified Halomonas]|uniref:23S rRNA (uracil(1939)-C(5))-methyltransferase RlmD n=1 Tax=unclassified Halomonas TaxID=2609666 RepID=UPI001EF61912|nr:MULTISPECIES: 23S rRNA (uracil(1939)-C(5))-methyltransferase RlmD [unclassified Halomonas]MCG7588985.1 23S rRNA (uracil(1939)-C(5))-methyltransferase RlmD [Halomonas sp. McD50-5]MCG7615146.1 23S rRNA (uracil(1939)-C(5))-methyltransferase RlmD [Halomonas sp. McD50-4]